MNKIIFILLAVALAFSAAGQERSGGGGSAGGSVSVGSVLYVAANGSDGTGTRGRLDKPFKTITAAANAAQAGDWVIAYPQLYTENNLIRRGVNYEVWGPITYTDTTVNGPGWGIWDDRPLGATTNIIILHDTMTWSSGTNIVMDTVDCIANSCGNKNAIGPFVETNALSEIQFTGRKINVSGFYQTQNAFNCINGRTNHIVFERIDDPFAGITISTNDPTCGVINFTSFSAALWWNLGDVYFEGDSIDNMSNYSLNGYGLTTNDVANLWWKVKHTTGKFYTVGTGINWKIWAHFDELETSPITQQAGAIEFHGSGKYYLDFGFKVNSTVAAQPLMLLTTNNSVANIQPMQLWITGQKLTSAGPWIQMDYGIVRFQSPFHFEQVNGGTLPGFIQTGGTLYVQGGDATNTTSVIYHNGGTAYVNGLRGVTTTTATPVFVNGAGLQLKDCVFVTPASTNCIAATNSQTVGIYGIVTANLAKHANITLSPAGSLVIDAAVK